MSTAHESSSSVNRLPVATGQQRALPYDCLREVDLGRFRVAGFRRQRGVSGLWHVICQTVFAVKGDSKSFDVFAHNLPVNQIHKGSHLVRTLLLITLLVSVCSASLAEESCAVHAARRLSDGKSAELSTWFKEPATDTVTKLKEASEYLGSLDRISPALIQSPGNVTRWSVLSNDLPSRSAFNGSWADAVSSKVGPVQIQASVELGSTCRLLALHIDIQNK